MLNKLTSLFYEPDSKPSAESKTQTPKQPTKPISQPAVLPTIISIPGQVDTDIQKILDQAITESNLPGFDYFEYRGVLANMSNVPLTEEQKFQTAFSAAQAMGVDKKVLTDSIDHYSSVLEKKEVEFDNYIDSTINLETANKQKQITSLEESI